MQTADDTKPGVVQAGKRIGVTAREWLGSISELATLEVRYSIQALIGTLVAALVLGAVLFSTWMVLLGMLAMAVVEAGWSPIAALVLIGVLNLVLAVGIWRLMHKLIRRIGLDSTREAIGLYKDMQKRSQPSGVTGHAEPA